MPVIIGNMVGSGFSESAGAAVEQIENKGANKK
jgi:hypothetical protein